MSRRIIVAGGSSKAGYHVMDSLLETGHQILNLDIVPPAPPLDKEINTLRVDLTKIDQVYSALTSPFHPTESFQENQNYIADAIVYIAAHSSNAVVPDSEGFSRNIVTTYNVLETACRLGIKKVVLASTVCVYGFGFTESDVDFSSFPVDEDLDADPTDAYAMSRMCGEQVARGFARRFGVDIYVLRIGRLVMPDEYNDAVFQSYVNRPEMWKVHGWSYTDARDLGQMCTKAIEVDGLGFQVFNATNNEITNFAQSSAEFLRDVCPDVPFTREMEGREAPVSNRKIRELLGFREQHPWQRYYDARYMRRRE